jgi:formate hydrogenlyase subunit 5
MTITSTESEVTALTDTLIARVADGGTRFAALSATRDPGPDRDPKGGDPDGEDRVTLTVQLARPGGIDTLVAALPPDATSYRSLTPHVPAAFWYERVIHDLTGLVPLGHPRLAPLIRSGAPDDYALPRHVDGYGLFTIPHGPVRSGVVESMEYLVETPGEAIPHLNMRIFYKHRAIADAFAGRPVEDGVLLAERVEGIASVAHALAYCHAIEQIADCEVPRDAAMLRVVHAELERIANHLDVAAKLADAAGLAVAAARFALHKERVMRVVSGLCGRRFGRGVVIPGGVSAVPDTGGLAASLEPLERAIIADTAALLGTSSFLDRLRGTGPLAPDRARLHGALGPIGKASGFRDDARQTRPYDGYARGLLEAVSRPAPARSAGDALTRLLVRADEVTEAFGLIRRALSFLPERTEVTPYAPCHPPDGRATGWAEAPQGEVLYDVTVAGGRVVRCQPRSASFHNLVLMHEVFAGDILTDFPFIEASFGLSVAGAAL